MGAVNAALGRVFASVPESTVMDVYNAVSGITDSGVPAYLKSTVNGADADKAYAAFLEFKDVVKSNQVASAGPSASAAPVDKAIVMGSSMDGNLLKAAAEAHHKAIGSIDAKGVTSAADYEAVNAALGRVIASVPTSKVMDVYNAFAAIVSPTVPNQLFSTVNAADANAAAKAFYEFKDVVKAAQR